jgi:ATP-dependent helicase/nuclease subunit B
MKRLSATMCETLQENPFAVYASHICGLREREPLDGEFSPREMGNVIHAAMEAAAASYDPPHLDMYQQTLQHWFLENLAAHVPKTQRRFHMRRLQRILDGILAVEGERAGGIEALDAEKALEHSFHTGSGNVIFRAKLDRLETRKDGSIHLIDYKTGKLPAKAEILNGKKCQLLVAGMLARSCIASDISIGAVEYWPLKGTGLVPLEIEGTALDWQGITQQLLSLAEYYCYHPDSSFPWHMEADARYQQAAAHLARVGEW